MEIDFNDSKIDFPEENISVENLLTSLEINPAEVVVTQNGKIALESSILKKGDMVKIIQVIYGG
ncbi:MAG: MoaD/ThiS family protein [Methanobacteriaceae archaeon]|jgi:sulfur carrier protein ThiS|nr:MoaD/ThiS family protein [Methanobacteriaceae archaeon]MDZ4171505.1 MoaD/ThiS family protein [Methanobacteriaceae archaeon]